MPLRRRRSGSVSGVSANGSRIGGRPLGMVFSLAWGWFFGPEIRTLRDVHGRPV